MCFIKCPHRLRNPVTEEVESDRDLLGDEVEMLIPCLDPNFRGDHEDFLNRFNDENAKLMKFRSGELDSNTLAESAPQF